MRQGKGDDNVDIETLATLAKGFRLSDLMCKHDGWF